jgi:hypothetical protein
MSTYIQGIKPPDSKWLKMKAAWDACTEVNVDPPPEVWEFFDGENPDEKGVVIDIRIEKRTYHDHGDAYEINLKDLDPDITIIRFLNSW